MSSEVLSSYPYDTLSTFRKGKRRGVTLSLMLCGRSGLGKSTFINTLCNGVVYGSSEVHETLEVTSTNVSLTDPISAKPIHLTVIDTPGFGDAINSSSHPPRIRAFVEEQFDMILSQETRIERSKYISDTRIHCCLYFLPCTGRPMQDLDVEMMCSLAQVVNVIPVIAKADTLTSEELARCRQVVREDINKYSIPVYAFGFDIDEQDDNFIDEVFALRDSIPFAISGSNSVYDLDGEEVRGRQHPWGFARCDDTRISDIDKLKSVLFGDHLQELKESTLSLYEVYRTKILTKSSKSEDEQFMKQRELLGSDFSEDYNRVESPFS